MSRLARTLLVVAAAGTAATAADARLLVDARDLRISTEAAHACGEPVRLAAEADSPEHLSESSARLQGVFDAARAMLAYECGVIASAQVVGRLRGMSQVLYRAEAGPQTNWLLSASRSASRASTTTPAATNTVPGGSRYQVRSLTTGLTVDEALGRSRDEFDVQPAYDPDRRELTVSRARDCERARGVRPTPGAMCLEARFTNDRVPRLFRLHYTQVVDGSQAERIRGQLAEAFGNPDLQRDGQRREVPTTHLGWGRSVQVQRHGRTVERHELRARVRETGDATVVVLDLLDPGFASDELAADGPEHQAQF